MTRNIFNDDRGASQVMGYAIIFALVLVTTIATINFAQPIINDNRAQQSALTATHNFEQLDHYTHEIERGANQRFVRSEYPAGQLSVLDNTTIEYTNESNSETFVVETYPLVYQFDASSASVIYDGRVVAFKPSNFDASKAQIQNVPRTTYTDTQYTFNTPNITYPGKIRGSWSRKHSVSYLINKTQYGSFRDNSTEVKTLDEKRTRTFTDQQTGADVNITVTTNVPSLWERYLEKHHATTNVTAPADYTPGTRQTVTAEVHLEPDETLTVENYAISIRTLGY